MKAMKSSTIIRDLSYLKLLYVLVPLGLLLAYIYLEGERDGKLMREQGADTECIMVSYSEGRTGQRGPRKGYSNQFAYYIGDVVHYCYVFTSVKPLPFDLKLRVRYLRKKDGRVTIKFPDEYKEQYKEYGFNDYGY
jgi:hypothetical protein